jgi:hypothetical protein
VAPGDDTTSWTTEVSLLPGDRVTWRASVIGARLERVPVATTTFEVSAEEDRRR